MPANSFSYVAYGLNVDSELECPGLFPGNGAADVRVRFGCAPERLESPKAEGPFFQAKPGQLLLSIDRVARFLVADGSDIVIEPAPGACEEVIRTFLVGSLFGALLHQRGMLPLHASAVEMGGGAVAFAGPPGRGKSTLAATFFRRGHRVLADDVCAVSLDGQGRPVLSPGYPRLNLRPDSLARMSIAPDDLPCTQNAAKRALPVGDGFSPAPVPLRALFELHTSELDKLEVAEVVGTEKLRLIRENTFRPQFLLGNGQLGRYLQTALPVVQQVRVARLSRPGDSFALDEVADLVELMTTQRR
ncbi:MAG: hypothetical protein HYX94_06740 [Chloroflexi bacterium]|nr:hypothetical protein [Chloroflexota bacterium]